jgi:hypothetical protein
MPVCCRCRPVNEIKGYPVKFIITIHSHAAVLRSDHCLATCENISRSREIDQSLVGQFLSSEVLPSCHSVATLARAHTCAIEDIPSKGENAARDGLMIVVMIY